MDTRPLCCEDFGSIQSINDLTYDGHDYIAAAFPDWMKRQGDDLWTIATEDCDGVTGAHRDPAGGLEVLTLYDGRKTGWLDALRVHPRARGKGIGHTLQQQLITFAQEHLSLDRVRLCTARSVVASRKIAVRCGMELHARWGLCFVTNADFGNNENSHNSSTTTATSSEGADGSRLLTTYMSKLASTVEQSPSHSVQLFEGSPQQLQQLFDQIGVQLLLQFWKVHQLTLEAVEAVLQDGLHQQPCVGLLAETGTMDSISWTCLKRDHTGMCAFITIYGQGMGCFRSHVMEQLKLAVQAGATTAMLFCSDTSYEPELHRLGLTQRIQTTLDGDEEVPQEVMSFELSFV